MFVRSTRLNLVLSLLFILAMGACGNVGGCGACGSVGPLPTGGLPKDQTIEGGAQVRVTPAGFNKLKSVLPALLNQQLSGGFCLAQGEVGNCSGGFLGTGACYCTTNANGCTQGCKVNVQLNSLVPTVTSQQLMNIKVSTSASTSVPIHGQVVGVGFSCTLGVSSNNLSGDFDVRFGTNAATGELTINLDKINQFQSNLNFSGCSVLSDIGNFFSDLVDSFLGQFVVQLLTPAINDLIQGFLPNPLGLAGMLDVGNLLEQVSPGTQGFMEARLVPGGYVNLVRNGMSLGMITGLNADEDPSTRTPGLTSEPALCVPPLAAPNFSAPPASLPKTSRSTYALGVANEFNGLPDPGSDITMGISETTLDLAGHHAVTSGMMCLGIGTSFVKQLNLSTIGLLVPSLADLGSKAANDPVLLVTRPQRPLDFSIGDNTPSSPALTIGISHLEVDFYAFLYERYTRAFTMDLTMNVGVNLDFEQPAGQPAVVKPSLVGISSQSVTVKVMNSDFLAETPQRLEGVLPSVFDLITPLLGKLPSINVPTFAGFSLDNLSIQHVKTAQDDFLALDASLGASTLMRQLGATNPLMAQAVSQLDRAAPAAADVPRSTGHARLVRVSTPEPGKVRAALTQQESGALPEVEFEVDRVDAGGNELEWSYNLNGGMWRPYAAGGQLVIRDRAFAWQGRYEIGLKSRVKGNYHTVSETIVTPVTIDSVGPRVVSEEARWDGDEYQVPLWDIVSGKSVQWALGTPGGAAPESAWHEGALAASRDELETYAVGGQVAVYAKDEVGNQTVALIAPFHGTPGQGGCACDTGRGPTPGGVLLVLIVGGALMGRGRLRRIRPIGRLRRLARRSRGGRCVVALGTWMGLSATLSLVPGCSCGSEGTCEAVADCGKCPDGQVAFCIDGQCECDDDLPLGRIGPYSHVAVGPDGAVWVSAYAETYGDLVVARTEAGRVPNEAWEWVDGVPDGPVEIPGSKYRGGISEKGPDAGMYTSIAVAPDGSPMVTYFEPETASLKFAVRRDDVWETHVIEAGTTKLSEFSGQLVGMYSALTLRTDDGRPGVAYLAHVADKDGVHAEVRFAASQVPVPSSRGDWQFWVVDSAPLPPMDPAKPDVYPLPGGLGLFIDAARLRSNQAPVVVYYDRANGNLKLAKFDPAQGKFKAPVVLDGSNNTDEGWQPTVAVGADDRVHIAYIGATGDDLKYITDQAGAAPAIIDDGYRLVGTTVDGLPKPEFHFVGEDATIVMANNGTLPMVVYQDATTQELLLATLQQNRTWGRTSIAGATNPWPGAYGFFASGAVLANSLVISTWVIDQPKHDNWVEVFQRPTNIQ